MELTWQPGQTPLDADEAAALLPKHLTTQADLDEWEAMNIGAAMQWLAAARRLDVLSEGFCLGLHRRMFCDTWKWAGKFRQSDKNIGVDWRLVALRVRDLHDDTRYWTEHGTFPLDEVAARFHHRLVSIHPFANGNGRHARLAADALLRAHGAPAFTWGGAHLANAGDARVRYIAALRAADGGNADPLLAFVRS